MDHTDYELLARVEAGGVIFAAEDIRTFPLPTFQYVVARLLQLRARGLVRFSAGPGEAHSLLGPCQLTADGRALLERFRLRTAQLSSESA